MSKFRKTIPVNEIKKHLNSILANSSGDSATDRIFREGAIAAIERLLLEFNYSGFCYLDESNVPEGCNPGCAIDEDGSWIIQDDTRRKYL